MLLVLNNIDERDRRVEPGIFGPEKGNLSNPTACLDLHCGNQTRLCLLSKPRRGDLAKLIRGEGRDVARN